jgi:transcription elongation factor Elf1
MPEPRSPVPLQTARVADLRHGFVVKVICEACGHSKEVAVNHLRQRLPPFAFVKQIGPMFRCQQCNKKGATVDARRALGHMD